ncbi:flagellar basal body L-ring protein FlgH [Sulfurimonas sp. HSL-1716]|uniref:flagellar basal body L-ring protein FlgH n=1 Tax=Hydrocurvibacter sulfurireducens TaxID=3131937 RepID=UPI0031F996F9
MIKIVFFGLYVILLFSGCTANLTDPEINFKPPKYVEEMPPKQDQKDYASEGSIFGKGDNPLFSDHKAMHVNDIVTIVISEATQSSNTGTKALSKSDTSTLGGGIFAANGGNPAVSAYANKLNGLTNIGFTGATTSAYTGSGSSTKDASFTTTVSARVIKVLENGNYFISGKREILIDDQKQIIQVSGVIRPYDISQNNQISSSQMSDAKILYKSEGDVDRATKQGWGTKIIQSIWPF